MVGDIMLLRSREQLPHELLRDLRQRWMWGSFIFTRTIHKTSANEARSKRTGKWKEVNEHVVYAANCMVNNKFVFKLHGESSVYGLLKPATISGEEDSPEMTFEEKKIILAMGLHPMSDKQREVFFQEVSAWRWGTNAKEEFNQESTQASGGTNKERKCECGMEETSQR